MSMLCSEPLLPLYPSEITLKFFRLVSPTQSLSFPFSLLLTFLNLTHPLSLLWNDFELSVSPGTSPPLFFHCTCPALPQPLSTPLCSYNRSSSLTCKLSSFSNWEAPWGWSLCFFLPCISAVPTMLTWVWLACSKYLLIDRYVIFWKPKLCGHPIISVCVGALV